MFLLFFRRLGGLVLSACLPVFGFFGRPASLPFEAQDGLWMHADVMA